MTPIRGPRAAAVRRRGAALLLLLAPLLPGVAAGASGAEQGRIPGDRLFAQLTVERKELFLQEVFDFTVSVYSRDFALGREISLANPEAPGLNFLPFKDLGTGRESLDGRVFAVRRFLGRAQAVAEGSFSLQPTVRTAVVVPTRDTPPGERSAGRAEVREVSLVSNRVSVQVRPLPEAGKPPGFTGAVGSFSFSAAVRPARVAAGDPVTLTMEIRGSGNVEAVAAPQVRADERFKAYEPRLATREISEDRSRGRLVFEQTVVPRSTASTTVPAVTFSSFDPVARSYRQSVQGPFALQVTAPAQAGTAAAAPPHGPGQRSAAPGPEIAALKPEPRRWSSHGGRPSLWFLAVQAVPLAVLVALLVSARRREGRARDVAGTRRQAAPEAARAGIGAAQSALQQRDGARFHEALWEALSCYFGNRLNLLPGEISGEVVTAGLTRDGVAPAVVARLGELFRLCEEARFSRPLSGGAPLSPAELRAMAGLLEEVRRLLEACEVSAR